jgi:NTE family protein
LLNKLWAFLYYSLRSSPLLHARNLSSAIPLAGLILLAGCAHAPLNRPLLSAPALGPSPAVAGKPDAGDNDLMVALFFSGGGTRAASLSYGVLKELAATRVRAPTGEFRLLDKVRVISAVSGGSFTAAYYCLYHDRIFSEFEDRFLKRNITAALVGATLNPLRWPELSSPYYGRSDLAADYYDKILFHGATFGDLGPDGGRPRLILNATDMANGEQFPFVPEHFVLIGSDLKDYRISRAIAAASAFPLLLSPITLKNYRGEPGVVGPDVLPPEAMDDDSRRNLFVHNTFRSYADYRNNPYIHLVDGGTSDNLGLESLIDATLESGGMERLIEQTLHAGPPRRFVLIVVNASVQHSVHWSHTEAVPGVAGELWRLADDFGEHTDAEFIDLLRIALNRWKTESAAHLRSPGVQPEYYLISVDLDQLRGEVDGSFFDSLPTNFHLSSSAVNRVVGAGENLLKNSPEYQRLLTDVGGSPARQGEPRPLPNVGLP